MKDYRSYHTNGFYLEQSAFSLEALDPIRTILEHFHSAWLEENQKFYKQRAINSAYITAAGKLPPHYRLQLFNFISDKKITDTVSNTVASDLVFMGTQLFFDPYNQNQKNYWHRDIQYNSLSIEQQKIVLLNQNAIHVRIALKDENGIELIPGTHKRWDSDYEYSVRLEKHGMQNHYDLKDSQPIPLHAGDMLIFSANMIHRGLYGKDRFAFDILFADPDPEILRHLPNDCLPTASELEGIKNPEIYRRAIAVKSDLQ